MSPEHFRKPSPEELKVERERMLKETEEFFKSTPGEGASRVKDEALRTQRISEQEEAGENIWSMPMKSERRRRKTH